MGAEIIGPTIGVGMKMYDLAKKQGWLDKLLKRVKGSEHVLMLGSTGTGKSQFLTSLHIELPNAIDEMARTEAMQKAELKHNGAFFDFIDTPGEEAKRAKRQAAYADFVSRDDPGGIINVVSYGYHEYSKGRDLGPLTGYGRPSKRFLEDHRRREIAALNEWIPVVAGRESVRWMATVVSKADLWWEDRSKVVEHYESGPYGQALNSLGWLSPSVVTYSSLRHKFYKTSRLDGTFDDHDLAQGRERMLRTLFELSTGAQ